MKRTPEEEINLLITTHVLIPLIIISFASSLLTSFLFQALPTIIDQLPRVNIQITPRVQD
jgi:hypothetical protein